MGIYVIHCFVDSVFAPAAKLCGVLVGCLGVGCRDM